MRENKFMPKPLFEERMKKLLREDYSGFTKIIKKSPLNFIRANTIKISPENLKKRLEKKWEITQPFPTNKEIMLIKSELAPGELGKSEEHILGYYYVQELSSMLSIIALNPQPKELVLDLCASPGSKTTQASNYMKNSGIIIANDKDIGRISILNANLERCGASNTILTRMLGENLCQRFENKGILFDKILVDAPCSGEGTLRSKQRDAQLWSINTIKQLSGLQKNLLVSAIKILKKGGVLVYSTCTHAPEENEEVVDFALSKFPELELEKITLPIKCRQGICEWESKKYSKEVEKSCRVYPQDSDTEGFFLAKFRRKE